MKLYAPKYYEKFTCIADRCRHSCCVGWEIDVDADTMEKYAALTEGYGKVIRDSIDKSDTPHFRLFENDRCPHLDDRGLCKIITRLGSGFLCHICREHPRFYHETPQGCEVGLGLSCEEACRLILDEKDYQTTVELGETAGDAEPQDFDPLPHRNHIYSLLSDAALPYPRRLRLIENAYGVSPTHHSDDEWRALLASLEYLNDSHRPLFAAYSSTVKAPRDAEQHLERALAYFVFRHCSKAVSEGDLRATLGFALFCERLIASMASAHPHALADMARIVSEELEYSEENTEAIKEMFVK